MLSDIKSELKATFNPKVSIIIPVLNGSDYLGEAIDSALAQTYNNIEILVINDGSNDEDKTEKIALSYGDRIRYFKKDNGGVATALNLGIKEMDGEYFSWLSHDDLFYPQKTEIQINELSKLVKKEAFVFSDFEFIDGNKQFIKYFKVDEELRDKFGLCILFNQIHGCSVLIHRNILQNINGFDKKYITTQDYNAWINIFKKRFDIVHIQDFLVKSRIHNNQGTKTMKDISAKEILDIERKYISEIVPFYPSYYNKIKVHYKTKNDDLYDFFLKFILKHENSFFILLKARYWFFLFFLRTKYSKILGKNIPGEFSAKAYERNLWGDEHSRSGPGSNLENTSEIRRKIPEIIKKYKIKTIVDAPCGDLFWMKEMLKKIIQDIDLYTGIDIVEDLIQNNNEKYGSDKIGFIKQDLVHNTVPKADLIICRDCFLHLSYKNIYNILKNFKQSESNLLLVSTYPKHININVYKFSIEGRAVNMEGYPFKIKNKLDSINENYHGQNEEYNDKSLLLIKVDSLDLKRIYRQILINEIFFTPGFFILILFRKVYHRTIRIVKSI
jgi:glycosyltransferase involved in cell wall biosynthesis